MAEESSRPRPAPAERFAGDEHVYDLPAVVEELRRDTEARRGHRQVTLFKHATATISLFDWEAGGLLPEHKANGYVTIHALAGRLKITTPQNEHELTAGRLLVMTPNVHHSVEAIEPSQMLLIVNLVSE